MLGLVVANSLLTFFVFWEIMGLCSYLLIGFWFEKKSAYKAAFKAFITTRIGDTIMFVGMMLLYMWSVPSTLVFEQILDVENLRHLAEMTVTLPFLGITAPAIAVIAVLLFFGTIGKSSQFPLHVWLPDAMEGPTPVSAMIHAATMVSAGVFLIVRMFPLYYVAYEVSPGVSYFVAGIGAFTALFASLIAMTQWDIKRVLAYSTIAQLGFMVAALGVGAYAAGLFHLITHAFFKALLFLGSGSVIHGVEHGFHDAHEHAAHGAEAGHGSHGHSTTMQRKDGPLDPEDPQDMRNMGGLLKRMPLTGWTFIIGGLALAGFPFLTAGFWSKDEIFAYIVYEGNWTVFWMLVVAALLTAFYTARQIMLTFFTKPRTVGAEGAHESAKSMTIPLLLIAPFAVALGWIGIPNSFPGLGALVPYFLEGILEPYVEHQEFKVGHPEFSLFVLFTSMVISLGGLALGWLVYRKYKAGEIDPLRRWLGGLWWVMYRKFYVDEFYALTIIPFTMALAKFWGLFDNKWVIDPIVNLIGKIAMWLSKVAGDFDKYVIDGLVNAFSWASYQAGGILRNVQNGQVQVYLLVLVVSITIWLLLYALPQLLTLV
jgi:NADH-quinone oxidoreductase subunit L